jgi:hypothetical protein
MKKTSLITGRSATIANSEDIAEFKVKGGILARPEMKSISDDVVNRAEKGTSTIV